MLTPNLDDAFYPALAIFAKSLGIPAEWFLNFFFLESRFDPSAWNGRYAGLNQIDSHYLSNVLNIDADDYRTWSASEQLTRVIAPFFKGQLATYLSGSLPASPGVLYALNLFPNSVKTRGDSPDTVIIDRDASDPGEVRAYYANSNKGVPDKNGNCGLDYDCNGVITISDLDAKLADLATSPTYKAALAKLYAAGASPFVQLVTRKLTAGQMILAYGLSGVFFATLAVVAAKAYLPHEKRPAYR